MAPVHTTGGEEIIGAIILIEIVIFVWNCIHNLCIGVSNMCIAIWTYPPFEAFRTEFLTAVVNLTSYGSPSFST